MLRCFSLEYTEYSCKKAPCLTKKSLVICAFRYYSNKP